MADLPLEGRVVEREDRKEVPLTLEQRVEKAERDIQEVARGVNVQAALLEGMVVAFDSVVKTYLTLIGKYVPPVVADKPSKLNITSPSEMERESK